jgi:hypothetical protein
MTSVTQITHQRGLLVTPILRVRLRLAMMKVSLAMGVVACNDRRAVAVPFSIDLFRGLGDAISGFAATDYRDGFRCSYGARAEG